MKIIIFTEGTILMHKNGKGLLLLHTDWKCKRESKKMEK